MLLVLLGVLTLTTVSAVPLNIGTTYSSSSPIVRLPIKQTALNSVVTVQYDLSTANMADHWLLMEYTPIIDMSPPHSRVVFSYAQVTINNSNASVVSYPFTGHNVDAEGFSMMKKQYVYLDRSSSSGTLYVNVAALEVKDGVPFSLNFDVRVTTVNNQSLLCPNGCNSNGVCSSNITCVCFDDWKGYDCSVRPTQLTSNSPPVTVGDGNLVYMHVEQSDALKYSYSVYKSNCQNNTELYYSLGGSPQNGILTVWTAGYARTLINSIIGYTATVSGASEVYLTALNYGPGDCTITIDIQQLSQISTLLIIMIVLGAAILISLIVGIVYIIRKKRQLRIGPMGIQRVRQVDINLSKQQIERYFPPILASKVMDQKLGSQASTYDIIPNSDCVICLCPLNHSELVKITYCNHIFHKDCLDGWFTKANSNQNCPYCRQEFDRQHIESVYNNVRDYMRETARQPDLQLQGQSLPIAIVSYHRAKAVSRETSMSNLVSPQKKGFNIETLQ